MSRGERATDIPVLIIKGVERAFKLYESWTRGHWLWYAPEYLITTEVARALADGLKSRMIELEYSVKERMLSRKQEQLTSGGLGRHFAATDGMTSCSLAKAVHPGSSSR